MNLSANDIKIIRDYFNHKPVLRAFVFGSFSRNDASKESDIDLLVELDYTQHIGLGFVNMKFELEDKLNKKVDLVSSRAVSAHILPFINTDKQLIYER